MPTTITNKAIRIGRRDGRGRFSGEQSTESRVSLRWLLSKSLSLDAMPKTHVEIDGLKMRWLFCTWTRLCRNGLGHQVLLCLIAITHTAISQHRQAWGEGPRLDSVQLEKKDIRESSGVAMSWRHKGVLWTHNDSGDKERIFAFDKNGKHLSEVKIKGVEHKDWEDIASLRWRGRGS